MKNKLIFVGIGFIFAIAIGYLKSTLFDKKEEPKPQVKIEKYYELYINGDSYTKQQIDSVLLSRYCLKETDNKDFFSLTYSWENKALADSKIYPVEYKGNFNKLAFGAIIPYNSNFVGFQFINWNSSCNSSYETAKLLLTKNKETTITLSDSISFSKTSTWQSSYGFNQPFVNNDCVNITIQTKQFTTNPMMSNAKVILWFKKTNAI